MNFEKKYTRTDTKGFDIVLFMAAVQGRLEGMSEWIEDEEFLPRSYYRDQIKEVIKELQECREFVSNGEYKTTLEKIVYSKPPSIEPV